MNRATTTQGRTITSPTVAQNPDAKPRITPTEGRVVLVFSTKWEGARPAFIVGLTKSSQTHGAALPASDTVRVNIFLDGTRDADVLDEFRRRAEGNTEEVILFPPLSDEQRRILNVGSTVWAEWMPYQQGQAAKTQAAEGGLRDVMAEVIRHGGSMSEAKKSELLERLNA